ncbi:MAG: hypothetical protein N2053_01690 [Chitinispirillaceae bacterium]|nr:hypothetical protein [Chitinispirillaceae bacterium]
MIATIINNQRFLKALLFTILIVSLGNLIAYKIVNIPKQLEFVILLSLFISYPIVKIPIIGIYSMFIMLPFIPFLRRLYYLQYSRPKVDPLIAFQDILILFIMIGLLPFFKKKVIFENNNLSGKLSIVILLYILYCILRTFVLTILPLNQAILQLHFYVPAVFSFYIGIIYGNKINFLKKLWTITIFIGILAALYGFKQLLFGYSKAEQLWFSSISFNTLFIKGIARPFSFFQSPACMADYMIISTIGVFIISNLNKSSNIRLILLILLPIFAYATLITSVRSNWIGLLLVYPLWFLFFKIREPKKRILIIAFSSLFFIFFQYLDFSIQYDVGIKKFTSLLKSMIDQNYISLLITERTGAITNPFEERSFLSRIFLWKHMITLSFEPVTGLMGRGTGSINVDSLYFNYLAQFGYPGFIFIIILTMLLIQKGLNLINRNYVEDENIHLIKGITIMNIILAIINITGTHIHTFPGDIYFWFWNGVLVRLYDLYNSAESWIKDENAINP